MADVRVHPTTADPPPSSSFTAASGKHCGQNPNPPPSNPVPPPATYVVQLPREQIFRYPPPENARKFEGLTRRKNRRSCCRRCCCFTFWLLLLLIVAAAVSAGVLYLVFRFKSPKDESNVRAENPNGKVGIYYLEDSAVNVFYNDVELSGGVLPSFYQPKKNVTVLQTSLKGSDVVLGAAVKTALRNAQNQGKVPLLVNVKAPIKIKVGSARTWEITAKVKCDVVVDALNDRAKIVSEDCDYNVRLW
ncbi:hypothetical protein Pfo_017875 [Paulownia fortunei]|nr:hypothetical protein Pfo_017875 [Paulownia fortunei]